MNFIFLKSCKNYIEMFTLSFFYFLLYMYIWKVTLCVQNYMVLEAQVIQSELSFLPLLRLVFLCVSIHLRQDFPV
jgi:hypothetical protein